MCQVVVHVVHGDIVRSINTNKKNANILKILPLQSMNSCETGSGFHPRDNLLLLAVNLTLTFVFPD